MTNVQKEKIDTMREKGRTFKDISLALGILETTVKSYCYRKKIMQTGVQTGSAKTVSEEKHDKSYLDYTPKQSINSAVDELKLIGAREAAKILGVNANTVYRLWAKGLLVYWCIHHTMKTNMKAIGEFLDCTKNRELEDV